jgi:PAS domain S-box-containing protein
MRAASAHVLISALVLGFLGLSGSAAWLTGQLLLASAHPLFIPMALGFAALARRRAAALPAGIGAVVCLFGLAKLADFLIGHVALPDVEPLFVRAAGSFGAVPLARVSPLTAGGLAAAGAAIFCLAVGASRAPVRHVCGVLGSFDLLLGAAVVLGYAYGTPLLYGGSVIPVALPTGVGLTAAGAAAVFAAGPSAWPGRAFAGSGARARLMRAFVPATTAALLVASAGGHALIANLEANPAFAAAVSALASAVLVTLLVSWKAQSVGGAIEHAERALRTAHQELDRRVAERTVELGQAHAFLDSIIENLPDMIFVKDARELRFVRINRAGEEMLGRRREEVIGRSDADLFEAAHAAAFTSADRETLSARRPLEILEEVVQSASRGVRVLHTKKIPIVNAGTEEPEYLLGISRDITDRKVAEEAVRIARVEAERASRAKSEFLSRMSHDLRTPLNAILGFAQLLQMDRLTDDQEDSVRQILKGGQHLLGLINEVLDIARIEAGQLSLSAEPVGVADVVRQVTEFARPLGDPRGIQLHIDASGAWQDIHVLADRQRLTQVLLNLVGNAVKYNRDGGSVRIAWTAVSGRVRIAVQDTGAGIPSDKLGLLYQPFERLGAEQRLIEGTGLGLAVTKGLTEAMGGTVGVSSVVDEGSTFWIELPETAPLVGAASSPAVAAAARDGAAAGTVLYVEDNPSNVRLLERLLARRGSVRLLTTASGSHALQLASAERPALILLDLHLPDMRGDEVLRRLWSHPATRGIPVAVLSADATPKQRERLLAAGAVAYLTKPLDLARLLALLRETIPATPAVLPEAG